MASIGDILRPINPLARGIWRRFACGASQEGGVVPPPPEGTGYVIHGTAGDWGYVLTSEGGRVLYSASGE